LIEKVSQIGIRVCDLDRAVAFYRDVLGLTFLFRVPQMAFFDCGGVRLLLSIPDDPEYDHASSIIYFAVADIRESFAHLRARQATIVSDPALIATMADHELWMAFFRDPDRNVLALSSEVPIQPWI
jgi:methylmalonyl-CoA/ethylmalonyl-CoA epimerase